MYKFKSLLLIGLVVAVAACGGQAPTTPVAPPTAVVAAPPTATTAAAAPTQPGGGLSVTPAGVSSPPKLDPAGMCKAASAPQPVPNFPAPTPADHVRGSDKASVVLYEYSDFQ
jgi:predicted small lipoprotein YifL